MSHLSAAPIGALVQALSKMAAAQGQRVLLVTRGERSAHRLVRRARQLDLEMPWLELPAWDCRPGDGAGPTRAILGQRASALAACDTLERFVLVVPAAAAAKLTPVASVWPGEPLVITPGMRAHVESWRDWLDSAGYIIDQRIDEPGEVAIRGSVIEVFPADAREPVRIDLADGVVTGVRRYDPLSQRTTGSVERLEILPASELVLNEQPRERLLESGRERGLDGERLDAAIATGRGRELLPTLLPLVDLPLESLFDRFPDATLVLEEGLDEVLDDLHQEVEEAGRPANGGPGRAGELDLLYRSAQSALYLDEESWRAALAGRAVIDLVGLDEEPADEAADRRQVKAPNGQAPAAFLPAEIAPGDHVVHADYGIARVLGLETIDEGGGPRDLLALEFAREKRLLIPSADLDRVWRYGSAEAGAKLDALDPEAWTARRREIEREIARAAAGLVQRARRRKRTEAPVIQGDSARMRTIRRRFGFEETRAQRAAISAVLADLASGTPMDRLVCGDVGYGKTEVAIRAAAAAATTGFQVALLAPTTVLARQHHLTFGRRFAGLGIEVGLLVGGMSRSETEAVLGGLGDGSVAIVIGTHALLGRRVRFANLALVIVDEEQRFGTRHKAQLASLGQGRHMLAMSATPIPRTLQAGLVGLRDLSVIDTPPFRRRPVRTVLMAADPQAIQQALRRESHRGGQSFCIVPRIADLEEVREEVARLMPELRIVVAHGRQRARDLDRAMLDFAEGDADVLVATAIVESGIDIPRANTMLVWRPDLFGLAQLHQLRGRVGRGRVQAYAYLLTDPGHELPEAAAARLRAIETIESLGGGFTASMLDLDRRGGGELGGEQQSGHVDDIGTELYQHLMARALAEAKGRPLDGRPPELELDLPLTVPADYLPEPQLRIGLHRRIARAIDEAELDALEAEVRDRFGPLPDPVQALIHSRRLGLRAGQLGLSELRAGPAGIVLRFGSEGAATAAMGLLGAELKDDGRLLVRRSSGSARERLDLVGEILAALADIPDSAKRGKRGRPKASRRPPESAPA